MLKQFLPTIAASAASLTILLFAQTARGQEQVTFACNLNSPTIKSDKLKTMPEFGAFTDPFQILLYNTVRLSLERDEEMQNIDLQLANLRKSFKDKKNPSPEALVSHKEGMSSIQGSSALLEQQQELRSLCATELSWEKKIDERYLQVQELFSELIESMNTDNYANSQEFKSVQFQLSKLIGSEETDNLIGQLKQLRANTIATGTPILPQHGFSVFAYSDKLTKLEQAAEASDPVLQDLVSQLEKKSHCTDTGSTHRLVSGGLNILSFVPGGVGDVAGYAQMAYDIGQGSDDAKLLQSVYLYKRAEIRKRVIAEAVNLSLHNYESSLENKNDFLLAFAKSQMADLSGQKAISELSL